MLQAKQQGRCRGVYINGAGNSEVPERELIQLDKAGYTVALNHVAVETVAPYVAAAERPALTRLLGRIDPEDELVVLQLSTLGCNARDVLATLLNCRKGKMGCAVSNWAASISRGALSRKR
ncbi:hypothetical protein [Paraburkholderia sp. CNPSo 3281]|uniref:hypothetical protein n=1 Tax=Paraburkholderia sp. CNPSo 3281 TaxID=2940933 RepID=UPI0020B8637B|nr:hypothetical protein [Paraburkholderia sp. CNPSo 3281]MCP3719852.1 hypothetical protein [Paraburkholderia sp. CNPSo 3281]